MSGAQGGEGAGPIGEVAPSANGDRDSVDDVIERLLSVRGESAARVWCGAKVVLASRCFLSGSVVVMMAGTAIGCCSSFSRDQEK